MNMTPIQLPKTEDWSVLKTPVMINRYNVPNRIVYQPMEGCDAESSGCPSALTLRRYQRFAAGGPGIIWIEATAVMPEGRANPRQLQLNETTLDDFKRLCELIKETSLRENGYAPFVSIQLTHSGRQSKPNGVPAPLIAYRHALFEKTRPADDRNVVTDDYLKQLTEALIHGAELAEKAGFDSADIKCSHAYLLSELLSAYNRTGLYGGSLENRTRLLREAIQGAVERCGKHFVVSSRLNIYDGFQYPWGFGVKPDAPPEPDYSEACWLVQSLQKEGLKLLNLTMGNPYVNPHVNRPYSKGSYVPDEEPMAGVVRMLTGIRTVAAAVPTLPIVSSAMSYLGASSPSVAAACIERGWFTFAGFGRMSFSYPNFAKDVCGGQLNARYLCKTCSKCTELMRNDGTTGCVLHDSEVYAPLYRNLVLKKEV